MRLGATVLLAAVLCSAFGANARRASPVDALLSKLNQDGRGVKVGARSGAPPQSMRPQDLQPPPPPPPPVPPAVPSVAQQPSDSGAPGASAPQAAGSLDQESLEAEALHEALQAPLIGSDGEDRSLPQPRTESGAGRKDDLRADRDSWGGWFASLLPGADPGRDATGSSTSAEVGGAGKYATDKSSLAPGSAPSSAPTGGVVDQAPVEGHTVPPPEVLNEQLWRKPGGDARTGRGRGRGRVSPVSELLKTMQAGRAAGRATSHEAQVAENVADIVGPDGKEQREQPTQSAARIEQSDLQERGLVGHPQRRVEGETHAPPAAQDDGVAAPNPSREVHEHSDALPAPAASNAKDEQQILGDVSDDAPAPVDRNAEQVDPKVIAMEKLKAFQHAAKARATSARADSRPSPAPSVDKMPVPVR